MYRVPLLMIVLLNMTFVTDVPSIKEFTSDIASVLRDTIKGTPII
jgi:hypothetical protein